MTIKKVQGQTVDNVSVYLHTPVFLHGQLYVACSRVTTPQCQHVYMGAQQPDTANCTRNVVYPEVL